jgi:hypothetical protein
LLDDAGLIDDHHAIAGTEGVRDQELLPGNEGLGGPRALPNEVLQVAHIDALGQRDALNRLAGLQAEQAVEILMGA